MVNYDSSTFRDHSKPNMRRLQELQHSEARAHAARVSYWRKKKTASPSAGSRNLQRQVKLQDNVSSASSSSAPDSKQGSEDTDQAPGATADTGLQEPDVKIEPTSSHEFVPNLRTRHRKSRQLGSMMTVSHSSAISNKGLWRSGSENSQLTDGRDADRCEHFAAPITLIRHPKSHLFDPFDSVPSRQGDEVVVAMDHCTALFALISNELALTTCRYSQLGTFPEAWFEIPDKRQPSNQRSVSVCSGKRGALRSSRCVVLEFQSSWPKLPEPSVQLVSLPQRTCFSRNPSQVDIGTYR